MQSVACMSMMQATRGVGKHSPEAEAVVGGVCMVQAVAAGVRGE